MYSSNVCGIYNSFWQAYYTYVCFWFLYMAIPITIMMIFGILAYRNLRGLTSVQLQGADQQLTLIICGQISMIIITVLPTCIQNAYAQITVTVNKSAEQKNLEFFIANIISFLAAIGLGGTFYIFLVISSTFRRQCKRCLFHFCLNKNATVAPINNSTSAKQPNTGTDNIAVFLDRGDGSFANRTTYSTGSSSSPYSLSVEYFNKDAYLDIIVANYNNNKVGVFLGRSNGIFDIVMLYSMSYGSHPSSLVVADFSRDRKMDFGVINNGTDSFSIYLQTC
ncbi:unnamed protein product [Adineta ricciae]|uniref:Uncharacterized protein n=1 Tax=Adineta ricciae TaxID=249248 RepID=A0A815CUI7_ADIRI|nr:unnamed protein product [Adineta ricciae]